MADGAHHEIIIIKRHGDHEEGHHGGAWKIALADFMTAMMALFLVMWLINSTSKAQKQSIAEYFNPVKLAEVTHDRKGLSDPQDTPSETGGGPAEGKESGAEKDAGKGAGKGAPDAPGSRARESALFQDPYAVLARLAAESERSDVASADAAITESGVPGISGGDAARDPFDPLYWQVENLPSHRTEQPGAPNTVASMPREARPDVRGQSVQTARPRDPAGKQAQAVMRVASADATAPLPREPAAEPIRDAKAPDLKTPDLKAPEPKATDGKATDGKATDLKAAADRAIDARAAEIKAEIAKVVQPSAAPAPNVEVRRTGEGVLISITDDLNFSMFPVGSAEPSPKVVKALERIARIVAARPGKIVVRGHTDGRPFRSDTYDNWRLSASRAQIAAYMLVRGGFDERRLQRIEGYADRQPRLPADPKAAENRRIEILLLGQPE